MNLLAALLIAALVYGWTYFQHRLELRKIDRETKANRELQEQALGYEEHRNRIILRFQRLRQEEMEAHHRRMLQIRDDHEGEEWRE